jgi:branched-chain amino acid transport system permease protein
MSSTSGTVKRLTQRTPLAIVGGAIALAFVPSLGLPAFYDSLLYLILHWVVLATSWNILSGYTGYFSFGHGAFFGAGLYTSATLMAKWNWPFLWTLPAAALVACVLGVGVGAIVFRVKGIRGEVFALLTLAVTFVLGTVIVNTPIDGGNGVSLAGVAVPKIGPTPSSTFYLLALAAAAVTLLAAWAISVSKLGAGLFAIHDDEDAAEVMGVPTYRYKLVALAVSCALAGVAGGIHALFLNYVTVGEVFTITVPLTVVLMSILGGSRHWAGPAIGAVAITLLLYSFTAANYAVAGKAMVGVILIAAILFMPEGILPRVQRMLARRRKAAAPVAEGAGAGAAARAGAVAGAVGGSAAGVVAAAAAGAAAAARPSSETAGAVLLRARGLAKHFRGVKALAGVDVEVRRGEILGLLGPNGSGKSTFINVVSGHYVPTGGSVVFEGQELAGSAAHRIARTGISRTYQIPRPFGHQTVLDNVALAAMFGGGLPDPEVARREAATWLAFAGLQGKAQALPDELNLHERKFLELARALASRPRLVLLDEVLCGLTPSEIDDAVALVRRIRDQGATVVFVEHVMRAVMALTDRVVVFDHGELLAEGPAAEVMQRPEVMHAYLGQAHGPLSAGASAASASFAAASGSASSASSGPSAAFTAGDAAAATRPPAAPATGLEPRHA